MFTSNLFEDFMTIHRNFDQLFNRVFSNGGTTTERTYDWVPPVESYVAGDNFLVKAYLPGVDPKNVEISTENNVLTIRGERAATPDKDVKYILNEVPYGRFERRITLLEGLVSDLEKCQAKFANGVLEIAMPVSERQLPRRIPIQGVSDKTQIAAA